MKKIIEELNKKFLAIKKMGWIKSKSKGASGIGITLENLLGITNNDFEIPDYNGIEIKSKRKSSIIIINKIINLKQTKQKIRSNITKNIFIS